MVLAVIAIAPLLLERFYNEEFDRRERIEAGYKQAVSLAKQGAVAQNEAIISARSLLQTIASARSTLGFFDDNCNDFLTRTATPNPWIKSLSVANLQGRIVCSSFRDAIGLDISDRPHFAKPIDSSDFFVSDYFIGQRSKSPAITIALAQRGPNGAAASVVLGLLDLSWFEHLAKNFVPPSGFMLMIDGKGTVLAQYPKDDDLVGRELTHHPLVQAMLEQPEGSIIVPALDGVRRIFGFFQLPGTGTRIAVGLDEKEVLSRADREMWKAITATAAVAGLVLIGIWFGGERLLVRPIRVLADTASRIGSGKDKVHAADLPWAAEFVPLAVALDDMAAKLSVREQELRDSNSQLLELAQTDGLTGLPNRRSFNDHLLAEWKLAAKLQQPLSVLMIDVDFFKKFNDHYGHIQGDQCLRKVSGVLREGTRVRVDSPSLAPAQVTDLPPSFQRISGRARKADFAARYGGEEFAVLLQGADLNAALVVGERLRQGVEDMLMAHAGAPWGFVSISIGAASAFPSDLANAEELTEAADAGLYEAKRQGRNRVAQSAPAALSHVS
jgi:GGDEF domain-containing protein